MQRRFLLLGLVTILAISAVIAANYARNVQTSTILPATIIGGAFSLLNQKAESVTEKSILGQYTLIFFGYTFCPDVCPTVLQSISASLDLLDKGTVNIFPIFITIDPERDTPDILKSYLKSFHPLITGLTGSPEQVKVVTKAYGVYYAKSKNNGDSKNDYLMDHSGGIYLMGPDGMFITKLSHSSTPEEIAKKIKKHL